MTVRLLLGVLAGVVTFTDDALVRTWTWLFAPVRGARRFVLSGFEAGRAFCSGSSVYALISLVEWAGGNVNYLPGDVAFHARMAALCAVIVAVLHLLVQLCQDHPVPKVPEVVVAPKR